MKTYKEFIQNIFEYDDRTDQYVADEIKRRKLAKIVVNATDDRRMITGKSNFTMPHHTGSSTIHVYLKKMSPSVVKYNYDLRFESVEEAHSAAQQAAIAIDMKKKGKTPKSEAQGPCWDGYEQQGMKKKGGKMVPNCVPVGEAMKVKQDPDIKDREGTQPAKYYAGDMSKSTKQKRAAHFAKSKSGPAPGDSGAKTKLSKHTKKYRQMFGEKIEGLEKKAKKSGISYSILKKVYDRGMAAWKTGHRPGTTPQQWAFARVNSFITGGGARKSDNDLWQKR